MMRFQLANVRAVHPTGPGHLGVNERGIIALLTPERLRRILTKMLDDLTDGALFQRFNAVYTASAKIQTPLSMLTEWG